MQSSVEHVVSEDYTELEGGSVHDSVFFPHGHGCCVQVTSLSPFQALSVSPAVCASFPTRLLPFSMTFLFGLHSL